MRVDVKKGDRTEKDRKYEMKYKKKYVKKYEMWYEKKYEGAGQYEE